MAHLPTAIKLTKALENWTFPAASKATHTVMSTLMVRMALAL